MSTPVGLSPLRRLRRKWKFTQGELACLISLPNNASVAYLERDEQNMRFDVLAAYIVVFGKSPAELCPERFGEVEEQVLRNAKELWNVWRHDTSPQAARRRELLALVLKRAVSRQQQRA